MPPKEKRSRTLIKVCGVRSPEEALAILDLGADAVGVVVAEGSPRQVDFDAASLIAEAAGPRCVLVDRSPRDHDRLRLVRDWIGPVQVHGVMPDLPRRWIHAVTGTSPTAPADSDISAWLLDAPEAGSGRPWAWTRPTWLGDRPMVLAGGLKPDTVASAIAATLPWAVDVSSGVEIDRGRKDLGLVRAFVASVRAADAAAGRTEAPTPIDFPAIA